MLSRRIEAPRLGWTTITVLGGLAAVLTAAASWAAGAVPVSFLSRPPDPVRRLGVGGGAALALFYVGLGLAILAWVALGRVVLAEAAVPTSRMAITVAVWAAPLLLAQPFGSRDLWSYAAQGHLAAAGLDPYRATPADRPGAFLDNVSPVWVHAASPYGPLWTLVSRGVVSLTGNDAELSAILLRVPAGLGLALVVAGLAALCARLGTRSDRALWATAASPLTLTMTLGGGHNDLLMVGLMVAGIAVGVRAGPARRTLVPAAALVTAAAAVKSPALVALAFLVPIWLAHPPYPGDASAPGTQGALSRVGPVVRATAAVSATALGVFGVLTAVEGHGLGWADQVTTRAVAVNWLSLPTAAAMIADVLSGHRVGATRFDPAMEHWRTAGLVFAAIGLLGLWLLATARVERPRTRPFDSAVNSHRDGSRDALLLLAAAFLALILLSPAVQPWYLLWALPWFAATGIGTRAAAVVTGVSLALVFMVRPKGTGVIMSPVVVIVLVGAAAAAALAHRWWTADLTRRPEPRANPDARSGSTDDHSDRARPGVGADRGADL